MAFAYFLIGLAILGLLMLLIIGASGYQSNRHRRVMDAWWEARNQRNLHDPEDKD